MVIVCIKLYTISDHYLAHGVDVEKLLPQSSVQKKRGHWGGGGGGGYFRELTVPIHQVFTVELQFITK